MVTYKDIEAANAEAKITDVKGQPYIAVHERVKAFRKVYPAGRIVTDINDKDGVCTATAHVLVPYRQTLEMRPELTDYVEIASGTARERDGSTYINKTSYVENCETSAVGRALGFAGFGIDAAVASAEEVQNAELNDISKQKIDDVKLRALQAKCKNDGVDETVLLRLYKIKTLADMTEKQYSNAADFWDKIRAIRGDT